MLNKYAHLQLVTLLDKDVSDTIHNKQDSIAIAQ